MDAIETSLPAAGFKHVELQGGHWILVGCLPNRLRPLAKLFSTLWDMHPSDYHEIKMHGRMVRTPRWQQAFGHDYAYTGRVNRALPVPTVLGPLLSWAQCVIDPRLNGILVNWYDGALRHYIGRHRDSIIGLVEGSPIVTISLGAERTFRLRPWPRKVGGPTVDLPATDGAAFVMPWATNRAFTHEVPAGSAKSGNRISVTMRAFEGARR